MFKIIKNNKLNLMQNDRTKMGLFILNYQRTDGETLFFFITNEESNKQFTYFKYH